MTMMIGTRAAPAAEQVARFVIETAWRQVARVRRQLRLRSDRRQLRELPDYLLKDLGITRSEIESVTRYGKNDPTRRLRV